MRVLYLFLVLRADWTSALSLGVASQKVTSAGNVVAELWGRKEGPDIAGICDRCAVDVIYEDLSSVNVQGAEAVGSLLKSKFPEKARLCIERVASGDELSGGFTWHRGDEDVIGLRGTLYARFNDQGELVYVREASEPLFKPGELTEKLLKAATANIEKEEKVPSYTPATPTTASGIVEYLWKEAYPKGAGPEVALDFFDEDVVYEDFNYPKAIVGKAELTAFLEAFDIPGIEFIPLEISSSNEDDQACVFTWEVKVNGAQGPQGLSFYQLSSSTSRGGRGTSSGKIVYVRDIPASTPAPLQQLAAMLNPELRVFSSG